MAGNKRCGWVWGFSVGACREWLTLDLTFDNVGPTSVQLEISLGYSWSSVKEILCVCYLIGLFSPLLIFYLLICLSIGFRQCGHDM